MTDNLRAFLNGHKDLIEKEDYASLYKIIPSNTTARGLTAELTALLVSCGAEPWLELETIPPSFIATVEEVESIVVTKKTKTIQPTGLAYCPSLKSIIFNTTFDKLPKNCCSDNPNLTSVTGHNATNFGDNCFSDCPQLVDVGSLEATRYIGVGAFMRTGLTTVKLGDDAVICASAFRGCTKLDTLELGAYLVRDGAFSSCFALKNVILTNPLGTLSEDTFDGCSSLTEVTFVGTKEQFNKMNKSYKWRGSAPISVIHCSDGNIRLKVK